MQSRAHPSRLLNPATERTGMKTEHLKIAWIVEVTERGVTFQIGGEHPSLPFAQRWAAECITPKRLAKTAKIYRIETTKTEEA